VAKKGQRLWFYSPTSALMRQMMVLVKYLLMNNLMRKQKRIPRKKKRNVLKEKLTLHHSFLNSEMI
jgi:hypothetical protein